MRKYKILTNIIGLFYMVFYMTREVSNSPTASIEQFPLAEAKQTVNGANFNFLRKEIDELDNNLQKNPAQAVEYLNELVNCDVTHLNNIEDSIKNLRYCFPKAVAEQADRFVNILSELHDRNAISAKDVRNHLNNLLPEIISFWDEPVAASFSSLMARCVENQNDRDDTIKKLKEKMPDLDNEVIYQQNEMSAYERISIKSKNPSRHTIEANKALIVAGLMVDKQPNKALAERKKFISAKNDPQSGKAKGVNDVINHNINLERFRAKAHRQFIENTQTDKSKSGALDAFLGAALTIKNTGVEEHDRNAKECAERDIIRNLAKEEEISKKYADRAVKGDFNILQLAADVVTLSELIIKNTPFVKESNIVNLTEAGKITQQRRLDKAEQRRIQDNLKELEKAHGKIEKYISKHKTNESTKELLESMKDLLEDEILGIKTNLALEFSNKDLKSFNEKNKKYIDEFQKLKDVYSQQEGINKLIAGDAAKEDDMDASELTTPNDGKINNQDSSIKNSELSQVNTNKGVKKEKVREKVAIAESIDVNNNLIKKNPLSITSHELVQDKNEGVLIIDDVSKFIPKVDNSGKISWRNLNDEMVSDGEIRFIITKDNTIYVGDMDSEMEKNIPTLPARPRFHHASLVKDEWPVFAGRATVSNGEIYLITNHSGHFAQAKSELPEIFLAFEGNGINVQKAKDLWFEGKFYNHKKPESEPTQLNRPLKDNPNARLWGVHDDNPDISRASISPGEYKKQVLE